MNGADDVYVERRGQLERVPDVLLEGEGDVMHLTERIVGPLGLRVDGFVTLGGRATAGGFQGADPIS